MLSTDIEGIAATFAQFADDGGKTLTQRECVLISAQIASLAYLAKQIEGQIVPMHARLQEAVGHSSNVISLAGIKRAEPKI